MRSAGRPFFIISKEKATRPPFLFVNSSPETRPCLYNFAMTILPYLRRLTVFMLFTSAIYGQTITVTSSADSGPGTLRDAIQQANGSLTADTIRFDTLSMGSTVISIASALPILTDDSIVIAGPVWPGGEAAVTIDGSALTSGENTITISGSFCVIQSLTLVNNQSTGAAVEITGGVSNRVTGNTIGLDRLGQNAMPNSVGVLITGGQSHRIGDSTTTGGNVISGNFEDGIRIVASRDNAILNNQIGVDRLGTAAGNASAGILINSGARANRIGSGTPSGRNIIGGNLTGIRIADSGSDSTAIDGNWIGVYLSLPVANGTGIRIENGASSTRIGQSGNITPNTISGNTGEGISIGGSTTRWTTIRGNRIGTDTTGSIGVGNGGSGIFIQDARRSTIGGTTVGESNVISGNGFDGILLAGTDSTFVYGNRIGVDVSGTMGIPNLNNGIELQSAARNTTIGGRSAGQGNVISGNEANGILIVDEGTSLASIVGNHIGVAIDSVGNVGNGESGVHLSFGASRDSVNYNIIGYNGAGIAYEDATTDSNVHFANAIFRNGQGIDIALNAQGGITPPAIAYVSLDTTVNGTADPFALVQIYADSVDQGRFFLDTTRADAAGNWSRKVQLPSGVRVLAIQESVINSSEFSPPFQPFIGPVGASISTLSFGDVLLGQTDTQSVRIYSRSGDVILTDQLLTFTGEFTILTTITFPETLTVGDTLTIEIAFTPAGFGTRNSSWQILNNSSIPAFGLPLTGFGQAGSLIAMDTVVFPETIVGDSSILTISVKAEDAPVQLTGALTQTPVFSIVSQPTLPFTLLNGVVDSVLFEIKYRPSLSALQGDTLIIQSNSPAGDRYIILRGQGLPNQLPGSFQLLPLPGGSTTNDRRPTFRWRRSVDADGDTVIYTLQISTTANFASITQSVQTPDTVVILPLPLDTLQSYFWRVLARDDKNGETVSNVGFFTVDAVAPRGSLRILPSPILQTSVAIYVYSSEPLERASAKIRFWDVEQELLDSIYVQLTEIQPSLFQTSYSVSESGTLEIAATLEDSAGNQAVPSRVFTFALLPKTRVLVSHDRRVTTSLSRSRGVLWLGVEPAERAALPISTTYAIDVGGTVESGNPLELSIDYSTLDVGALGWTDDSKIGIYRMESGTPVYIGGAGKAGRIVSQIDRLGRYVLGYDPNRQSLPRELHLDNYPNPFNPITSIRVALPFSSDVRVEIYNLIGQRVKTLYRGFLPAGRHTMTWNGTNETNDRVASGIYLCRVSFAGQVTTRKMLLVK